ncbi:MAG: ATP-binding cassette domain-containing protein [Candidatus Obscuribacterales bacterium]|nr:ATP-binding cassette domain-containing protein [Candidatus Obscuribacterales bacterium]
MKEPLVHGENISYFYGNAGLRKQVLVDVNITVESGEIVILTGPSGSGKTTLLTLVGCLRMLPTGSLIINGAQVSKASEERLTMLRRGIGFIFQSHNLHNSLTALQNVRMGLEVHGKMPSAEMDSIAQQKLAEVGLSEHGNHYPKQLSGGQKQRVAVARALSSQPSIILADEPTAALDSKSGRDVVALLHRLAKEKGTAILMVTHDNRILDVADRIINMEDGRIKSC